MLTELDKKRGINGIALLITCAVIIYVVGNMTQQNRNARIGLMEDTGAYTIGTVISYDEDASVGIGNGAPQSIRFSYRVNNAVYETKYSDREYPVPPSYGPKPGSRFMAIYLPNDPEKCAMLFNYPVRDSLVYKGYLMEFKAQRPTLGK